MYATYRLETLVLPTGATAPIGGDVIEPEAGGGGPAGGGGGGWESGETAAPPGGGGAFWGSITGNGEDFDLAIGANPFGGGGRRFWESSSFSCPFIT